MGDILKAADEQWEGYKKLCSDFREEVRADYLTHLLSLKERKKKKDEASLQEFQRQFGEKEGVGSIGLGYQITHIIVYAKGEKACKELQEVVPKNFEHLPVEVIVSSSYR